MLPARVLAARTGRFRPASVLRRNCGSLSPDLDLFWILPGILFEILDPPADYAAEHSRMDADGSPAAPDLRGPAHR